MLSMSIWEKIEELKTRSELVTDEDICTALGKSRGWLSNVRVGYAGIKAKDAAALVGILAEAGLIGSEDDRKAAIFELLSLQATPTFQKAG